MCRNLITATTESDYGSNVLGERAEAFMADVVASVTIQGTRPLLWHHCGPDAIPLQAKAKTGKAGNDPSEWKSTVLATDHGQLYLEPSYIFGLIRDGARFTPRKRGTLQGMVAATVEVLDEQILTNR